jgi:hypothetical protein
MDDDRLGEPLRPQQSSQRGRKNEQQEAEQRRTYEQNYHEEQLRQREEFIKQRYGADLVRIIEQRSDVQDEHIKALAAEYLAKNLAARVGEPEQNTLTKLAVLSTAQALNKIEELQHEQLRQESAQQQREDENARLQPEPRQAGYYAKLDETHRRVGEEIESQHATRTEPSRQDIQNARNESRHGGRYADLEDTHNLVEVERAQRDGSAPLNRSEREAREAEAQTAVGEITDAKAARLDRARALSREFGSHFEREDGNERDGDDDGRSR